MSSMGAPCAAGGTPRKASLMRTQPAGSSCPSVCAAGLSATTHASRPLWQECPLPRTCTREGKIPRRARTLANRHRKRLCRRRNRRRPSFNRRAAAHARRRGLGCLGQALPPPRKVQPGIPVACHRRLAISVRTVPHAHLRLVRRRLSGSKVRRCAVPVPGRCDLPSQPLLPRRSVRAHVALL